RKIYGDDFKKGWTVDLEDVALNAIYKAITGFNLETNNYRRRKGVDDDEERRFGLFQYLEHRLGAQHLVALQPLMAYTEAHGFDSDAVFDDLMPELDRVKGSGSFVDEQDSNISESVCGAMGRRGWRALKEALFRWKKIECKEGHELKLADCRLVEGLMANLRAFQEEQHEIDASNVYEFNLEEVVQGFDHLISVHKLFLGDKRKEIRQYVVEHVACTASLQCAVLEKHSQRKRENVDRKRSDQKVEEHDAVGTLCEALSDNLNSAHCYLLHQQNDNDLYRLSSCSSPDGADSRFSTAVQVDETKDDEKDEKQSVAEPLGIDFGVNVLEWLPFGEEPQFDSLRTEIVENAQSTIDEALYDQYQLQCLVKAEDTDFVVAELLALKLFTDTTAYQGFLRKAHWTISPLALKKSFYHWARAIYLAALRHSVPIPSLNQRAPRSLYHGLNRLFTVGQELPIYFGPFSSTVSEHVAESFGGENGLIFQIQPSYSNMETCCVGIDVAIISQFKHEKEILLVNQVIPIQKATTSKVNDDKLWVDHFMYTLKARTTAVMDRSRFFQKMGVQYTAKWDPFILKHPLLLKPSGFGSKLMAERLVEEFMINSLNGSLLWLRPKEYGGRCVLEQMVEKSKNEALLTHYRVYKSRFEVGRSGLCRGTFLNFKANDRMNHIVGDGVTVDTRCFAETEYLINGQ
ncbi:MAG: hypothetical protein GY766_14705, partial [Herbaspirillum sp.]|uniref:hypothetical protein n=1 Tax=Herbaspirillum sp. TaxID=1890675 RepID=UPI0025843F7A